MDRAHSRLSVLGEGANVLLFLGHDTCGDPFNGACVLAPVPGITDR